MRRITSCRTGFTLIEMMVSLALLMMILLLLFSSLHTANRSFMVAKDRIAGNDEIRLAGYFIRRQIAQMTPIFWVYQKKSQLLFQGRSDMLRFVSHLPAYQGSSGLHVVTLKLNEYQDVHHLDFIYFPLHADYLDVNSIDEIEEKIALIGGVDAIRFSYYGIKEKNIEAHWYEQWENERRLPQLIKLEIKSTGHRADWPGMIIPVRVQYSDKKIPFTLRSDTKIPLI